MHKLLSMVIIVVCLLACREIDNKKFTSDERKYIDSVYQVRIKESQKRLDSLCKAEHDKNLQVLSDSIKQEYIKEIEAIVK